MYLGWRLWTFFWKCQVCTSQLPGSLQKPVNHRSGFTVWNPVKNAHSLAPPRLIILGISEDEAQESEFEPDGSGTRHAMRAGGLLTQSRGLTWEPTLNLGLPRDLSVTLKMLTNVSKLQFHSLKVVVRRVLPHGALVKWQGDSCYVISTGLEPMLNILSVRLSVKDSMWWTQSRNPCSWDSTQGSLLALQGLPLVWKEPLLTFTQLLLPFKLLEINMAVFFTSKSLSPCVHLNA